MHIVNSDATYHTAYSDSLLDVLIVNNCDKVHSFVELSSLFIAGHDLLELSFILDVSLNLMSHSSAQLQRY